MDYEHIKDYIIAASVSLWGYLMYKIKSAREEARANEERQNDRIDNLERRVNNVEKYTAVIEERTKHIIKTCEDIKKIVKDK